MRVFTELHTKLLARATPCFPGETAFRFLLAGLLPGIPFIIARTQLHQHSGIFNIDYLLLAVLATFGRVRLASALFVLTYFLECVRLLDAVYFFTQQDLTFAARFLADVPLWIAAAWLSSFVLLTVVSLGMWRAVTPHVRGPKLWVNTAPLLLLAGMAAVVDIKQGFNPLLVQVHGQAHPHLIGEVLFRMPVQLTHTAKHDEASTVLSHSATELLWGSSPAKAARQNVVVVVVESMGLLTDSASHRREFDILLRDPAIVSRYAVSEGTVPFSGGTVVGEMRELCHLQTGVHVGDATMEGKAPCLPKQFRSLGYQTASFHGYRDTMFSRRDWYPKLGFDEQNFLKELNQLPKCDGAFYGVCDASIASLIQERLVAKSKAGGPPQFLYWMTLNSHLPIYEGVVPSNRCPVASDFVVCAQLAYVSVVLRCVKNLALDGGIGPTTIVVVGDHAPPYISVERRDLFDGEKVPFIVLQPRAATKLDRSGLP